MGAGGAAGAAVRAAFAGRADVDEDVIGYVVSCLEDDAIDAGDADGIFEQLGDMLVRR